MAIEMSAKEAALLLKLNPERIRQLAKEGIIAKTGRDQYPLVPLVQGYIGFLKANAKKPNAPSQTRLNTIKAKTAELQYEKERGNLIALADAFAFLDAVLGMMKSRLLSLPKSFTRNPEIQQELEKAIVEVLNAVAKEQKQEAARIRKGQ